MGVTDEKMRLDQPQPVRLTQHVKAGSRASKLPAGSLRRGLSALPAQTNPDLLVGFETSDDPGIVRIGPGQALVQTIDFFTPWDASRAPLLRVLVDRPSFCNDELL
jgi:selenophosphate synthase